jgi:WS/DGAT/MGAT family acyltransferase
LGWPLWVDAASFDLADHVQVHPLAAPGNRAQLLHACEQLAQRRLDPARPLWQLWLMPGLPERRVGALFKMHHAMADGMAGVAFFGALLDLAPDAPAPVAPAWTPTPVPTSGELLRDNLRRRGQGLGRALAGIGHPSRTLSAARRTLPAWREFLTEQRAPRTSLNRPIGVARQLAIVHSRLEFAKQIAHTYGAKVNDVVLTAVAGGLRQLLASRGEDIQELTLRAMVPISLHHEQPGQSSGNQDGWMIVPLPLGEPDPVRRLHLIAAETAQRKHVARPRTGSGVSGSPLLQRGFLRGFARQRLMNTSVTNVPGPPVPLYLAGARLLELVPLVSLMGNLTLVVAALSYAGELNLTAVADRDTCPDVDVFAQGVRATLDELEASVLESTS